MNNVNKNVVNYCRADNKVINYECIGCSFYKKIDLEIHQYLNTLYPNLDTAYLKESF